MPAEFLLDGRLAIHLDLTPSLFVNSVFESDSTNRAHFANQLLIYDRLVIPTKDFGIVPILYSWFGEKYFYDVIHANALFFFHKPTMIGYAGNGAGLVSFSIQGSAERKLEWWQEATFAETSKALDLQIKHRCPSITVKERNKLCSLILESCQAIEFEDQDFEKVIVHETYTDILKDRNLERYIAELSGKNYPINLQNLPGVKPADMKVSHYGAINEPVDLVLRISEINMSLRMANMVGNCDLYAPQGSEKLLQSKLNRHGISSEILEGFIRVLELNNLPDPGQAIVRDTITLNDIWDIRQGPASRKFREWLRNSNPEDARELEQMYVASLKNKGLADSLPLKSLRFALTLAAGVINPIVGLSLDVVDSFFVDKWLQGYSPDIFIDQMYNLYGKTHSKPRKRHKKNIKL